MKKLLATICFGIFAATAVAQTPKLINYQGVARGNDGAPVLNQAITLRFRILQGSVTGSVAYIETQAVSTNSLGLILTQIGLKADLGTLSWKNGPYFLEVAADMTGGSNVEVFGIQQIMGVPYAFHAATVPAAYNATTNVLDVGGNTFTLSTTPQTTLTATGIASVQSSATNSFVVSVPTPSYTAAGPFTVSGTYPNYTMTAQSTSVTGTGNAVVTSTASNQFNVNVPFPQVSLTSTAGATGIGGSGTNSININIPAGVTPSITPFGVLTRTASGSNFSLSVPGTSVTGTGAAAVSTSGTNTFAINVPAANVVLTATPGLPGISSPGTNSFNINIPAANVAVTSTAGAIGVSSPGTNSFNINVPQTSVAVTSTAGAVGVTSAGTNSFSINVPPDITPTITPFGVLTRTAAGSSFSLTVPGTSVTASGAASITSVGTNTFNVNVPQANVALTFTPGTAGVSSPGTNSFAINLPASNIALTSTAGAYAVSSPGTNSFNVNVPATGIALTTTAGLAGISATGTNSYNINVPAPNITPNGLVQVTQAFNNFTVNVPLLTYTAATAGLGSGSNSVSVLQALSINNGTLTSGPSTNSVSLASIAPWRQSVGMVTLTTATDKVGIGGTTPIENLQVESIANTSVSILAAAAANADISFGTAINHNLGRIRYDNTIGAMSLWTAGTRQFNIASTGLVTVGASTTAAANTALVVSRAGAFNNQILVTGGDATDSYGGMISFGENINPSLGMSIKLDAGSNRLFFTNDIAGNSQVMSIGGYFGASNGVAIGTGYAGIANPPANGLLVEGNTGIGSANPGTKLEVIGDISIPNGNKIQFGTLSSGSGIGEWIQNSGNALQFNTASLARMTVANNGFVGIGTTAPSAQLHVVGTTSVQGSMSTTGTSNMNGNVTVGVSAAAPADIRVFGQIRFGSETGTSQPPTYPTGSSGMTIRRVFTSNTAAGQTVATTPDLSFERDGSAGGFRITRISASIQLVCNCTGVVAGGTPITRNFSSLPAGSTVVFSNADNVVYFNCMFGDPFFSGTSHVTEISLVRQNGDFFWVGNIISTQNQ